MVTIDLGHQRDAVRVIAVVRQRMMRDRDTGLRVRTCALLLAHHERDDARQVSLKRQQLQVLH